jgi:hypothetical protein
MTDQQLNVAVNPEIYRRFKKATIDKGTTMKQAVEKLLELYADDGVDFDDDETEE